jgi:hypothetical protein
VCKAKRQKLATPRNWQAESQAPEEERCNGVERRLTVVFGKNLVISSCCFFRIFKN